jgi:Fe2+ transport system protein B
MAYNQVEDAIKKLEERVEVLELRSKLLAGKTSEITQILEVKHIEASKDVVEQAITQKIDEKTAIVAQQVEEKTQAIAKDVEDKRVELAENVDRTIKHERSKSMHEIEALNQKSIHRARQVFYIIVTIFIMMVATSMLGFHAVPIPREIIEATLAFLFVILATLIVKL